MGRKLHILTARQVATAGVGSHADGGGLYLRVKPTRSKSWIFRYTRPGTSKVTELGLGALHTRTLAEARALAADLRRALAEGKDPAEVLRPAKEKEHGLRTFADCARALIEAKRPGWRNAKHAAQWVSTLETYAFPVIGHKAPADVSLADVLKILTPIWSTKTETASRLRQRIEAVLDYAAVHGLRSNDNPARWKGVLDKVLPAPSSVTTKAHHPALPYERVADFMAALREQHGMAARCLEFVILTACRSGEARGATWDEIDLEAATWTIPAHRMKARREHRVPLSKPALELLKSLPRIEGEPYVFPAPSGGALSDMSLTVLIRRMQGYPSKWVDKAGAPIVVHGFRSTFRTWCEEQTSFPRSVTEAALAHVNADRVEAAYLRSDLFEKRRALMEAWADYCTRKKGAKVVQLTKRREV
jgi:integrase